MAFVLRDGLFHVKCRQSGCPFRMEFKITQNIMGETEQDCEGEAMKIARDMGSIKHDALYGRSHALKEPVVRKVGGSYVGFGTDRGAARAAAPQPQAATDAGLPHPPGAVGVRRYAKDDVIVRKGERAITVCEVLQGSACPEHTTAIRYAQGSSFGAAGLLSNQARTGSVIALEDDTVIAFYNIQELTRTNPTKARELYNEIMEDTLHVIAYLDERVNVLEDEVARLEAEKTSAAPAPARPASKATSPAKAAATPKGKAKAAKPRPKS